MQPLVSNTTSEVSQPAVSALGVCAQPQVAARLCAYCGKKFTPPARAPHAQCCCTEHRRKFQDDKRKVERLKPRLEWANRAYRERVLLNYDSLTVGSKSDDAGRYRTPARAAREYIASELERIAHGVFRLDFSAPRRLV